MKKTTINDIAEAAQVSKTTVSRFLNQKYDNMSADTKKKIAQTIKDLNYSPNRRAQSLKNHRSHLIGISVADISNPYTSRLLKGVNSALADTPYQIMIMDADNSIELEALNIQKLIADEVDAIILQPLTNDLHQYQNLIDADIPTIQVDRYVNQAIWPSVVSDNFAKSFEVGELIKAKGYQHVVLLTNSAQTISSRKNRVDGLTESIAGSPISTKIIDLDHTSAWDKLAVDELTTHPETVLYALNGEILWKVIRALRNHGVSFPETVGLIGYDDDGLADLVTPAVSAITQDPLAIGQTAADKLLVALTTGEKLTVEKIQIPALIEQRASL
ncbi:LacI family DNA-binding transcriptional regulator [Furfurilactobacillus entadae]|uniref:LacI family DNA-binding transcriptional regulator n=1 Tax=Furfurilactobacillus entadae TaxID=2922307 RepID=UPI0035F0C03B